MSGVATAVVVGSAVSGYMAKDAAGAAATAQGDAAYRAAQLQKEQYQQSRKDLAPWRAVGGKSIGDLWRYGRSDVAPGDYIPESAIPEFDSTQFDIYKDPSYDWRQSEQERMINRNMAGMGKITSGNRLEEIMARSGEMASQEYGAARGRMVEDYGIRRGIEEAEYGRGVDEYGRAYGEETDYLNRLAAMSGVGQTSAAQTGQFGTTAAANQGTAIMQAGQAQAAGELGQTAAYTGAIGDLASLAARYQPARTTTDYSIPMTSYSY